MDPFLTWDDGTEVVDSERLDPSAIRDIFDIQNLFEIMRLSMAKSTLSKGKYSIYKIFLKSCYKNTRKTRMVLKRFCISNKQAKSEPPKH